MKTLKEINTKNQIIIPSKILRMAGINVGEHVEIILEKGNIIIRPKEVKDKSLSKEDWDKLEKLVKKDIKARNLSEHSNVQQAKTHVNKLTE